MSRVLESWVAPRTAEMGPCGLHVWKRVLGCSLALFTNEENRWPRVQNMARGAAVDAGVFLSWRAIFGLSSVGFTCRTTGWIKVYFA